MLVPVLEAGRKPADFFGKDLAHPVPLADSKVDWLQDSLPQTVKQVHTAFGLLLDINADCAPQQPGSVPGSHLEGLLQPVALKLLKLREYLPGGLCALGSPSDGKPSVQHYQATAPWEVAGQACMSTC